MKLICISVSLTHKMHVYVKVRIIGALEILDDGDDGGGDW